MTNTIATKTTYYTVTFLYPQGIELTSKECFASLDDAKSYVGREIVADDGTMNIRPFRINTHTVGA